MGIAVEPPAGDRQRVQQVGVHWSCFGEDLGQPPARVDRQLGVLGDQLHRLASTAQWLTVDQHPPAVGRQVAREQPRHRRLARSRRLTGLGWAQQMP